MVKDELLGKKLGSYQLVRLLGRGAFGRVYLGKHFLLEHKPPVAIKVLNTTLQSQKEIDRFFQEALLLDKLSHPNILPVVDANIYEEYPYFVAEYAPNGSLREILDQLGGTPMPLVDALHVLTQVGKALQHAHDLNVVHRDLKPANILFDENGDALLADFGIALELKKTSRVDEIGTPAYMAPEQFKGQISKKSDQYALACITYEMLTGQLLFTAEDPYTIGYKHIYEPPIEPRELNPDIPHEIEQVILKALAKHRDERYESVEVFVGELVRVAGGFDEQAYGQMSAIQNPQVPQRAQHEQYEESHAYSSPYVYSSNPVQSEPVHEYATENIEDVEFQDGLDEEVPPTPVRQHIPGSGTTSSRPAGGTRGGRTTRANVQLQPMWTVNTGLGHVYYAEPTVVDGVVYVGTYAASEWDSGDNYQLHALDGTSGQRYWSYVLEFSVKSAPVVEDGIVYVATGDPNKRGRVYAIDAQSGQKVWTAGTKEPLKHTPVVANGTVFFNSSHVVYAVVAESGQKRWAISVEDGVFAPPAYVDGIVYVSTNGGHCYGLDAASGEQVSAFTDVGNIYTAAETAARVFCIGIGNDAMFGDDAESGKTFWHTRLDKNISSGLLVEQGVAYICAHGGQGETARGRLYAIEIGTGKQLWVLNMGTIINTTPVYEDGIVYVGTFGKDICAVDAKHGQLLSTIKVGRGRPTRPTAEHDRVYVSTGELYAYQLK